MMLSTIIENPSVDHIISSETYRLETFSNLVHFPLLLRQQLAIAGFVYQKAECVCLKCGIQINLTILDENLTYSQNYFRRLHRKKVSNLGKRCAFLLCEVGTNIDDLHPPLSCAQNGKLQWDDAEQPEFSDYNQRLQTFQSWPHLKQAENTFVKPSIMAEQGFYYSGFNDSVTCFYCGNTLTDWSELINSPNEFIVQLEHARFFPCRFVTYIAGGKFIANAGCLHSVTDQERRLRNPMICESSNIKNIPQSTDECLLTFENWPEFAPVSAKDLAETGFYYLGDELHVKCYMCDLEVDEWYSGMTALGTHNARRNGCPIIRAILSTATNNMQCVYEKWRLQTLGGLTFGTDDDFRLCQELAACGFFRFKNTQNIRCAYCAVSIQPKINSSIMSQHRYLAKQRRKSSCCLIVRAQCPTNVVIEDRKMFPEYPQYRSIFDRIDSFQLYVEQYNVDENFIRERAAAGFFFDTIKRMRCFQCGNPLPINKKKLYTKYSYYNVEKLHAHFYPTCEWVKEILGCKYVAQVLQDRLKSNEFEHQRSYGTQFSTISNHERFSSVSSTSDVFDFSPAIESNMSDYSYESDVEGCETVATPFKANFSDLISSIQSTTSPPTTPPFESSTTSGAQCCTDIIISNGHAQQTSPVSLTNINPLESISLESKSPPVDMNHNEISPVIPNAYFSHESNRLDSFKQLNRQTFSQLRVEEIAYAGFYLNAEGTLIRCPWCSVEISEAKCEDVINRRPGIPGSPLNSELWTAMRVHRHEIGQLMDKERSWCPYVRREKYGLHLNDPMPKSFMAYPEYPSYSVIENRIRSFQHNWIYPSGSRLSNVAMADAGFIYLGEGKVCCYYCGNKLHNFESLDCPYEEHAKFHPLCDYIIHKRGLAYIDRVLKEAIPVPHARQKCEMRGTQIIKYIYFNKSVPTPSKNKRSPVQRIDSRSSISIMNRSRSYSIVDDCHLCYTNQAIYEYNPCQHSPMCGECFVKLTTEQLEECFICLRRATISRRISTS